MEKKKTEVSSQLQLTLVRDPKISTLAKPPSSEEKGPPSGSVVSLVGGAKSSPQLVSPGISKATAALTQTQLFSKILSAVPMIKQASGKVHRPPSANLPSSKPSPSGHMDPSTHIKLSSPLHTKPSSHMKQPFLYTKPQPSSHTNPPPSPHTKPPPSSNTKPTTSSPTKPLLSLHTKPLPSSHVKAPPSLHTKPAPSHPKVSHIKSSASQVANAKQPPPLIKVATAKSKPTAKSTAGMKTITVKIPPSLLGSAALTSSSTTTSKSLPNTSQIITVTLPESLITNSAIPLLKTSSSIPLVKMSSTQPIVKTTSTVPLAKRNTSVAQETDSSLSPPKAKKPKVMKTSLLPMSRVRTIMKTNVQSSQPSLQLSQEAVLVIAKATELFISKLSQGAQEATPSNGNTVVGYNPLASSVQTTDKLKFLRDIVPKKVSVKDYLEQQNTS